ncbi:MAG: type III-B CRISPR module RAMP protein Cmr1 [Verrucomicrobia bacterium]|nr:type III-B CRISPR module RAMP protein Cmr1 [Verrucomicrobiota bacterium]
MKTETFHLELITPCFCGGAEPDKQAEIRAPSIRGQLRWWFRTLGGFQSLAPMSVRDQEAMIFGSTAGDEGRAGKLIVRVASVSVQSSVKDGQELGHANFTDPAYLTFPIQTREKQGQKVGYSGRGVLAKGSFGLCVTWRGGSEQWENIRALIAVLGHLGAMGFRGRRAMGALAFQRNPAELSEAFSRFTKPDALLVRTLGTCEAREVIPTLGGWLKRWRAYGRTGKNNAEQKFPGFKTAMADHDHGLARLSGTAASGPTYRPTVGLPIVQFFSSNQNTVNWEWDWNFQKKKGEGRFASPVLLRPHRDAQGKWHALVIFVDAHQWPADKKVFLNGQERNVSLDLYEAMKKDEALKPFHA